MIYLGSGLIHMFAAIMISYYRRKYQKEDTAVYFIKLRVPESPINTNPTDRVVWKTNPQVNTSEYNKILFQVNNMMTIGLYVVVVILFAILAKDNPCYLNYLSDFLAAIMLGIVIPCIFYIRNPKARLFVKECLVRR